MTATRAVRGPSRRLGAVEVRRAASDDEVSAARALRRRVFCDEQHVPLHEEEDGRDAGALHLVGVDRGTVVGTCRLIVASGVIQLSRLAVARPARRRGLARALLAAADDEARAAEAERILLHAQTYARDLYLAAGYAARGPLFFEAGIEHVAMEKRVA